MTNWLKALDRILRGEMTRIGTLRESLAEIPLGGMTVLIVVLGAIYGLGMGTFALALGGSPGFAQFLASAVKVPMLFLLTLVVTFPSLYVFNALVGSRLDLLAVLRLLIASLSVTLATLASFGPIIAFFSVSTTSYSFMVLLNVAACTTAGVLGLLFLRQTLHRLTFTPPRLAGTPPAPEAPATPPPLRAGSLPPGPLDLPTGHALGSHVRGVFRCWMILFMLVGSQMAWVLRPFIGEPGTPFSLFRHRQANFFVGVWEHLQNLFR
jgi:hypothetical protein